MTKPTGFWSAACAALAFWAAPAWAQQPADVTPGWMWSGDAQIFLSANLQERKFRDFHYLESQNWLMLSGVRRLGRGRLSVHGMLSFEDFTLHRYGSPQVFQTGETFDGAFLIDYQHPHDLVMAASARFEWPFDDGWRVFISGGPVASPAVGPVPFMHRTSARANPTAPLSHHNLDSTHVTHGVVTLGVTRDGWTVEASGFHGREPDEDRVAVEFGPIDSYSGRVTLNRGPWHVQVSAAHIKFPDPTEFTDHDLFTASVSHQGQLAGRPLAWTAAFGLNREAGLDVTMPAWLIEGAWHVSPRDLAYARAELADKDILTPGGYDPPDFVHPHILSRVGALTLGYERQLAQTRAGHFGLGADATVYARDENLIDNYGRPFSMHVFLRYRFAH